MILTSYFDSIDFLAFKKNQLSKNRKIPQDNYSILNRKTNLLKNNQRRQAKQMVQRNQPENEQSLKLANYITNTDAVHCKQGKQVREAAPQQPFVPELHLPGKLRISRQAQLSKRVLNTVYLQCTWIPCTRKVFLFQSANGRVSIHVYLFENRKMVEREKQR